MQHCCKALLLLLAVQLVSADLLGKLVYHGKDTQNAANKLSILHQPANVNFAQTPGPIAASEIASVLSLATGVSTPNIEWNGLFAGSFFDRPKAVCMFTVESVPKDSSLAIQTTSFPVAQMQSAQSVSDVLTIQGHESLTNHISKVFDGKSLTISVSGNEELAAAGYANGKNSKTMYWSDMGQSWKVMDGNGEVKNLLKKEIVMRQIKSVLPKGFSVNKHEMKVEVNTNEVQVSFDLMKKEEFQLFSELVAIQSQIDNVNMKQVNDDSPDVYLFSISTLKDIELTYGPLSPQMKAALLLLSDFIPRMSKTLQKLYKNDILIVQLSMESTYSIVTDHKPVIEHLQKSLEKEIGTPVTDFHKHMPEIHLPEKIESQTRNKLCEALQGAISGAAGRLFKFQCASEEQVHMVKRRSIMAFAAAPGLNFLKPVFYAAVFPVIFNIWLWLVVVLGLAIYAVSLVMWNMEPGDSVIYRLTQPKIKAE